MVPPRVYHRFALTRDLNVTFIIVRNIYLIALDRK
nr:MAG TPA: hypothetical protein [Caudoviricetes sp.]